MNPSYDHEEIDIELKNNEKVEIEQNYEEIPRPRANTADLTWENLVIKDLVLKINYHAVGIKNFK